MFFQRFYDESLAQASYLVGCQAKGEAIVIDPSRNIKAYLEVAAAQSLRIVAVTETHIHADFLSGLRQLAQATGAKRYLSGAGDADWQYQFAGSEDVILKDGDVIHLGNLEFEVWHTPGHTPEHLSFVLTDRAVANLPMGAFTGDFIFVGDVGRPDLLERAAGFQNTMKAGAQRLYQSLQRFSELPDHLQIWPGHGSGSACGKALGGSPSSVLGFEKLTNWAFQVKSEQEFVEEVLSGQPEPPVYFAQMKRLNQEGPPLLGPVEIPVGTLEELKSWLESGLPLVDLRGSEDFAAGHLKGSLFIPPGKAMVTWAGWVLGYDQPFAILMGEGQSVKPIAEALRSIGLDQLAKVFPLSITNGQHMTWVKSQRLQADQVDSQRDYVVDVRALSEWKEGHLEGAHHIHLGQLLQHLNELPQSPVLHCRSGLRSLIASSLLERAGLTPRDVCGGYMALAALPEKVKGI